MNVDLPVTSRYKDTTIIQREDGKVVPALIEVPEEFHAGDSRQRFHEVRANEVGNLDRIAVRYYGEGLEALWVGIALANGISNPEFGIAPGDRLVIPPREQALRFLARAPADAGF
jgi:nucleoid-associated protein YgaU